MDINEILERLDSTVLQAWHAFLASSDEREELAEFRAGVQTCADQLQQGIAMIREEIANG